MPDLVMVVTVLFDSKKRWRRIGWTGTRTSFNQKRHQYTIGGLGSKVYVTLAIGRLSEIHLM